MQLRTIVAFNRGIRTYAFDTPPYRRDDEAIAPTVPVWTIPLIRAIM